MSQLSRRPSCLGLRTYKVGWVLGVAQIRSATAVRGCREALMSCIMGVRREAELEGLKPDPCPALCRAAQTVGEG